MFVDTHCHIDKDKELEYVSNAIKVNVKLLVNASEDIKSSFENIEISNKFLNVFTCIGVHPLNVDNYNFNKNELNTLISNKKVVAIGEIGLDYYYSKDNKVKQQEIFDIFLSFASEKNLPVVIHSREATLDTLTILKKYKLKGIIHCFSGSLETANEYIKMGFLIGVGGVLTFKNSKLYETIKNVPLDKIVLETDSPFLAPEPLRGTINESKNIPIIAKKLAEVKGVTLEEVMNVTTSNALSVFDIGVDNMI